jgi:hypothetical protein
MYSDVLASSHFICYQALRQLLYWHSLPIWEARDRAAKLVEEREDKSENGVRNDVYHQAFLSSFSNKIGRWLGLLSGASLGAKKSV